MIERRNYVRFQIKLPIRFKDLSSNQDGEGELNDISAKGAGFTTDKELSPNTPLNIYIQIPNKNELLNSKGEVVWSKKIDSDKYRVGVELEQVDFVGLSIILSMFNII